MKKYVRRRNPKLQPQTRRHTASCPKLNPPEIAEGQDWNIRPQNTKANNAQNQEANPSNVENQGSRFRALAELDFNANIDEQDKEEGFLTPNKENIVEIGS